MNLPLQRAKHAKRTFRHRKQGLGRLGASLGGRPDKVRQKRLKTPLRAASRGHENLRNATYVIVRDFILCSL